MRLALLYPDEHGIVRAKTCPDLGSPRKLDPARTTIPKPTNRTKITHRHLNHPYSKPEPLHCGLCGAIEAAFEGSIVAYHRPNLLRA